MAAGVCAGAGHTRTSSADSVDGQELANQTKLPTQARPEVSSKDRIFKKTEELKPWRRAGNGDSGSLESEEASRAWRGPEGGHFRAPRPTVSSQRCLK